MDTYSIHAQPSERTSFLAPFIKKNSISKRAPFLSDANAPPIEYYLDFKKALLPSMLDIANGLANESSNELHQSQLKTALTLLPTDSQWYQLNQLRIHAGAPERSEAGLLKLRQYYQQLLFMEQRFPFETLQVDIQFQWQDSLHGDAHVTTNCIQYEKAAVLFNIASIYGQLGTCQRLTTEEGKKDAAIYFQKASSLFIFIRDTLCSRIKTKLEKWSDLHHDSISALAEFMLAQATECLYEKANDDQASSAVTSMIAIQTADHYDIALRECGNSSLLARHRFPKSWVAHLQAKACLFTSIAHLHAPSTFPIEKSVAERIARLEYAQEYMSKAIKYGKETNATLIAQIQEYHGLVSNALSLAESANFEHHHQHTLDIRLLAPLKRPSGMLLELPGVSSLLNTVVSNMFHAMVTPNHHDDLQKYLAESSSGIQEYQTKITALLYELDGTLKQLDQLNQDHSRLESVEPPLSRVELISRIQNVIQQIQTYHKEESLLPIDELSIYLSKLHDGVTDELNEILSILEKVVKMDEKDALDLVDSMKDKLGPLEQHMMSSRLKMSELKSIYSSHLSDFSLLAWTEDKVKAVLPLQEDLKPSNVVHLKKEKGLLILKLEDLGMSLKKQLDEFEECGLHKNTLLHVDHNQDIMEYINSSREQLKDLESQTNQLIKDISSTKQRLLNVCVEMEEATVSMGMMDETQTILMNFEVTMQQYIRFREGAMAEVNSLINVKRETSELLAVIQQWLSTKPQDQRPTFDNPFVVKTNVDHIIQQIKSRQNNIQSNMVRKDSGLNKSSVNNFLPDLNRLKRVDPSQVLTAALNARKQLQDLKIGNPSTQNSGSWDELLKKCYEQEAPKPSYEPSAPQWNEKFSKNQWNESNSTDLKPKNPLITRLLKQNSDMHSSKPLLSTPEKVKQGLIKMMGLKAIEDEKEALLAENQILKEKYEAMKSASLRDSAKLKEVLDVLHAQEERLSQLEKKKKKKKPVEKEWESESDAKSDLSVWLNQQRKRQTRQEMVMMTSGQEMSMETAAGVAAAAATIGMKAVQKMSRVGLTEDAMNSIDIAKFVKRKNLKNDIAVSAEQVERKDSGLGPSQASLSPTEEMEVKKKFNRRVSSKASVRDAIAKMKRDNDVLVQQLSSNRI